MTEPNDASDAPAALALTGIGKRFGGVTALDDVSLVVRPGTVHALLGENGAGKTTLMRIAYGMLRPDAGRIAVDGATRTLHSPAQAIAAGIGMVHQHFTLVPAMTVAENLALGGRGAYSPTDAAERVREVSTSSGFALDPEAPVESLPVGAQQRVEIAKALARRARILVFDEPTGVLAPAEVDDLLRWLRAFVIRGNSAVLITHKLREALAVADDVTVLRHGRQVLHGRARDMSESSLTVAMIGDDLGRVSRANRSSAPTHGAEGGTAAFRAVAVSVADELGVVRLRDASFDIRAGELVGVVGVEGAGQRELLRALAGRLPATRGALTRPRDVGFVPEDRHHDAVLLERSLVENVALRGAGAARGRIDWGAMRARTRALMAAFDVRASDADVPMRALSGGNQQKLVLGRELGPRGGEGQPLRDRISSDGSELVVRDGGKTSGGDRFAERGAPPNEHRRGSGEIAHHQTSASRGLSPRQAIIAENPTRGLDVRATAAVHERLREAASHGAAVVVYSSDLDEVLALADRVLVVFAGGVREFPADRERIGRAMLGLP